MHISSFVNKPDDVSPHSNEYAAGTISTQSFAARQEIERNRQRIQGYRYSHLGVNNIDRMSGLRVPKRPLPKKDSNGDGMMSRQTMNAQATPTTPVTTRSSHRFQEPPSRGYNPYK